MESGQVYQHLKTGRFYRVLYLARHTETNERMVVYRPVGGGEVWVRPAYMFEDGRFKMVSVGGKGAIQVT